MAEVIGVRFKNTGKVYYFDPEQEKVQKKEMVIVETARGVECGETAMENREGQRRGHSTASAQGDPESHQRGPEAGGGEPEKGKNRVFSVREKK